MRLMKIYYSPTNVSKQLNVYPQRIEKIYHYYTQEAYETHEIAPCEEVGVDETSTRKGHHYITTFVNMKTGKPIDIQDDKGSDTIKELFEANPNPAIVKDFSLDMSPAFVSGCKTYFPWANLTFDKWHVYKLLAKHLERLYRKFKDKTDYIVLIWSYLNLFYQQNGLIQAKALLVFIADFTEYLFGKNTFSKSIHRHFDPEASGLFNTLNQN